MPPKMNDYADFLTQFELFYRDTEILEIRSKNHNFLKNKLKDTFLGLNKSYYKIVTDLSFSTSVPVLKTTIVHTSGKIVRIKQ